MRTRSRFVGPGLPYEFIVLVAAIVYFWSLQLVTVYASHDNGGIVVGTGERCVGVEFYGHPGWWAGECDQ